MAEVALGQPAAAAANSATADKRAAALYEGELWHLHGSPFSFPPSNFPRPLGGEV